MTTTTWIVVGHRAGARILEHIGPGKGLQLVAEIEHTVGRLKTGELDSDRPGMAFRGQGRHPMSVADPAHEHVASEFARSLVEVLEKGRTENRFSKLVLVAEPHFLGLLRSALGPNTASMVSGSVAKDLAHVATADIEGHLGGVLPTT